MGVWGDGVQNCQGPTLWVAGRDSFPHEVWPEGLMRFASA